MTRSSRIQALITTFIISSLLTLSAPLQAQTFSFTAIPDQDSSHLSERFNKVADYLTEKLGIDVVYIPVKSYAASVAAFKNNQVQLAWFGGLSGVQARRAIPQSSAIAQGQEDQHFHSYFIAHRSTGIEPSDDFPNEIEGGTFTFGSKSSTSGRLMPEYYIQRFLNQTPEHAFKRVGYSGDHSRTIALVQAGSYQFGAVNYRVWEQQLAAGLIDTDQVQVIWQTPEFPDYNWSIRGDVDTQFGNGFFSKVQNALLQINDPDLLALFPRLGFIKANNELYQPILDTAITVGIINE